MQKFLGLTHWMKFIPTTITDETFAINTKTLQTVLNASLWIFNAYISYYRKAQTSITNSVPINQNSPEKMQIGPRAVGSPCNLGAHSQIVRFMVECEHNAPSMLLNPVHSAPSHACNVSQQLCRRFTSERCAFDKKSNCSRDDLALLISTVNDHQGWLRTTKC